MAELLASLDDINAHLPSDEGDPVVEATDENTNLLQISVARVIRGNLSTVLSTATLLSWDSPEDTPEYIREIAGMLIASQLYFNETAKQSLIIDDDSVAQRKYNEAMAMLNAIVAGNVVIPDVAAETGGDLSDLDFFPVDDTGRAFTIGMEL